MSRTGIAGMLGLVLGLALGLGIGRETAAQTEEASGADPFRVIMERNIFNPDRRAGIEETRDDDLVTTAPVSASNRETVALLGVWITDAQRLAFIQASRPGMPKVIAEGDRLGGGTVQEIRLGGLVLDEGGSRIEWPIGRQVEREPDGAWQLGGMMARTTAEGSGTETSSGDMPTSASILEGASSGESEILKRMMERRRKESGQ